LRLAVVGAEPGTFGTEARNLILLAADLADLGNEIGCGYFSHTFSVFAVPSAAFLGTMPSTRRRLGVLHEILPGDLFFLQGGMEAKMLMLGKKLEIINLVVVRVVVDVVDVVALRNRPVVILPHIDVQANRV
jgi:hypothetical protein